MKATSIQFDTVPPGTEFETGRTYDGAGRWCARWIAKGFAHAVPQTRHDGEDAQDGAGGSEQGASPAETPDPSTRRGRRLTS